VLLLKIFLIISKSATLEADEFGLGIQFPMIPQCHVRFGDWISSPSGGWLSRN